jgi:hypothetical protein
MDVTEQTDDAGELAYRWCIRALYGVAIGLNVYLLMAAARNTDEMVELRARFDTWRARVMAPVHERKLFRNATNHVLFEAQTIVEEAADA